jgi:DNA repair protein RadA/Sms
VAKKSSSFICQKCGYSTAKWIGRCPDCGEWNTILEEERQQEKKGVLKDNANREKSLPLGEIAHQDYKRVSCGMEEFDRVVGGGVVPGSLILIGGEPGIGKSTLLTAVMGRFSSICADDKVLYISGEESCAQVASRSKRLGISEDNFLIYHETNWENMLSELKQIKPKFIVIDSIQTTTTMEINSAPGTISQIREVTYELMNHAKANDTTCFIIGHITKEGSIAGPKVLEHMVDTVIYFEGDQFGHYRLLRVIKNRFGDTNEVGIFEMKESGLAEVRNPSQYFLEQQQEDSFGRSLTCVLEGNRPIFVEIQALVVDNKFGNGRRTTHGVDSNRLAMLVAVIEKYMEIPLGYNDIYLNIVGGIKLASRESDLGIVSSLISSYRGKVVDDSVVLIGEVGLTGEVRMVPRMEIRLKEMAQLNYRRVITAEKVAREYQGKFDIELIGIKKVEELVPLL